MGEVDGDVFETNCIADIGLHLRIELDFVGATSAGHFLYIDIGFFLKALGLHLMPKFEDQAWVPIFTVRIEDLNASQEVAKAFTLTITQLPNAVTTGNGGGISVA